MEKIEVVLEELGYFTNKQCENIKKNLEGYSYMNFEITWSSFNNLNCILIVRTEYETTKEELKNFFLHCALGKLYE